MATRTYAYLIEDVTEADRIALYEIALAEGLMAKAASLKTRRDGRSRRLLHRREVVVDTRSTFQYLLDVFFEQTGRELAATEYKPC